MEGNVCVACTDSTTPVAIEAVLNWTKVLEPLNVFKDAREFWEIFFVLSLIASSCFL